MARILTYLSDMPAADRSALGTVLATNVNEISQQVSPLLSTESKARPSFMGR